MAQYNPSQVHNSYWVYALEQDLAARYPSQDGKWMMFFPMSEMDARWNEACQLYRSGKLFGVNSMKASTAQQNPMPERLHGYNEGIIIFYCGPSEDEQNVMQYGRNILNNMHYPTAQFYYKSDKPHLINPHKPYKHMYFINTQEHYGNRGAFASAALPNFGGSVPNLNNGLYYDNQPFGGAYPSFDHLYHPLASSTAAPLARSVSMANLNYPFQGGLLSSPQSLYNLNHQFNSSLYF